MTFTPTATRKTIVLGSLVLGGLAVFGAWNVSSLVESVNRLLPIEAANQMPPFDRDQRQHAIQALHDQAWWIVAVFLASASAIVGFLLAANWLVHREFAQRQLTDKRLREREARLKTILDSEPECVKLVAEDGRVLEMNAAGLQMIEAGSASQVIGHQVEELLAPEYRREFQLLNERVFRGESTTLEYELIGLKGGRRWMETHAAPLRDEQGRVIALLGITRDITERKQAEVALRKSEAVLELVLNSIPQGVFWKDRRSRYLGANRVARNAMGVTESDSVVGMTDFDVPTFRPAQAECFVTTDREVMDSNQPKYAIEEFMTLPNGSTIWLETNKVPMHDTDGNVSGVLGTWEDVTEHKWASEGLRAGHERLAKLSQQLLAAQESERRQVARELHDEIGQMLTAVSLNLRHLKSVCGPDTHSELDAGLGLISHAMTQVRDLSLSLRPPMLDLLGLDAAVRSCVEQHRRQTGCDVQLEINLESRLSPELEITCYRVIQSALTNITRHAQASQISVEIREEDLGLELAVRDNGIGLDLDRFRERSEQGECFGILAMQERVQFLGGSFRIDSAATPGTGTSIHAHFPLATTVAGRSDS